MKNIDKLTMTKAVGGAAVLLILVVGYLLVLSPRLSKVDEIKAQTDTTAQNNQVVTANIADLKKQQDGLGKQRKIAQALGRRFPSTAVQSDMFADIRAAAERAGIRDEDVTALTPTVPAVAGSATAAGGATLPQAGTTAPTGMASMEVAATVTGSREQLQSFLAAMEQQERSYLFDTAGLSPAGVGEDQVATGYTLTVTGSMFLLPGVPDPDAPAPPAAPATTTPSTATAP